MFPCLLYLCTVTSVTLQGFVARGHVLCGTARVVWNRHNGSCQFVLPLLQEGQKFVPWASVARAAPSFKLLWLRLEELNIFPSLRSLGAEVLCALEACKRMSTMLNSLRALELMVNCTQCMPSVVAEGGRTCRCVERRRRGFSWCGAAPRSACKSSRGCGRAKPQGSP